MTILNSLRWTAAPLVICMGLVACGGGGSGPSMPTVSLSASPTSVAAGRSTTLTWSTTDATSCTASGAWTGSMATSGNQSVTVLSIGSNSYTLTCTGSGGTASQSAVVTATPPPTSELSSTFQMMPDHSGEMVYANAPVLPATQAWSVNLNASVSYPVIAGGLVFVTSASTGVSGYGTTLYALDEHTGKTVWGPTTLSGTYFWSGATYENGKLFVVNYDGLLRSFDAATGTPGWSVSLPGQYSFSSPPTAYKGIVYIGGAESGGTLYAVDETNGNVIWTQSVANGDNSSPAVDDTGVYVSYPCQVYDFTPSTGVPIWHYAGPCDGGGGRTPALKDGLLYVRDWTNGSSSVIYNAATGAQTGTFTATAMPAISHTTGFYLDSGTLRGVDLQTGNVLWSFAGDGQLVSAPIVVNNFVIVGSGTGAVFAVDAGTGAQQWTDNAGGAILAPDEQNVSQPLTGLASGEGMLIVPAGSLLTAWQITTP